MESSSFSASNYFAPRRRVQQACLNCSTRKTRCDGTQPKCSICTRLNIDCEYRDSQQPRIDQNTRILLERIRLLEERIFASPVFSSSATTSQPVQQRSDLSGSGSLSATSQAPHAWQGVTDAESTKYDDIQISLSNTANSNHVYSWPIVQELLSARDDASGHSGNGSHHANATDIFFEPVTPEFGTDRPPESWRLFHQNAASRVPVLVSEYKDLIHAYFAEVNIFFPVLSLGTALETLDEVVSGECRRNSSGRSVSTTIYAQLLLVLCFGSFVNSGRHYVHLRPVEDAPSTNRSYHSAENTLWGKAKLLLGWISSDLTLEAAQCTMVAR